METYILWIVALLIAHLPIMSANWLPYPYWRRYEEFITLVLGNDYDKRIRPVVDQVDPVNVSVEFQIISISKLDTFDGSMDFAGRLVLTWNDQKAVPDALLINFQEFNARLAEQDSLWTPDIAIFNSMRERERLGDPSYRIRVDLDGNCEWLVGVVATTSCSFDVTLFPFDKPTCEIVFTTWQYKSDEVLLLALNETVDMTWYVSHSEWAVDTTSSNHSIQNDVVYLNYTISFKRQAGFVLVNIVVPIIVVSLLNAMVFLVPHESGERITYAVFLFLWFVVYLDIVTSNLPVSSDNISNLSLFVIYMVCLSIITVFLDVINIMLFNRDERKQVPVCIESFVRFLRCRCGGSNRNRITPFEDVDTISREGTINSKDPTTVAMGTKPATKVELRLKDFEAPNADLKHNKEIHHEPRKRKSDEIDWKVVAVTFDYIFFVFVLFTTLGICAFFLVPLIAANNNSG